MNATQLLAHFDRLAEAPNAVPRLRRFILDLAVRGKLVAQDAGDEPAAMLINHIEAEKSRLVRAGLAGKQEVFESKLDADTPFPIPTAWVWVPATFPAYMVSDLGKKVQTKEVLQSGEFPVVDQGKVFIRGYCNDQDKVIRVVAPLILFGDHTRETKLIDFDFVVGADGVKLLQPVCLFTHYYFLALQWLPLDSRGYGRHFKLLKSACIPLPPLVEQHRIVAKVDELMALCDQLETAQHERERRRDCLAAASLQRLNQPAADATPATQLDHARFHLHHLPRLTTRPEHIKAMRQLLINVAVAGKLVQQNSDDESAQILLRKIHEEKVRCGLVKLTKEDKQSPFDGGKDHSNNLAKGWLWITFESFATEIATGPFGSALHQSDYIDDGVPLVNPSHMIDGRIAANRKITVTEETAESLSGYRMQAGDIVMARRGEVGRAAVVTEAEAGWLCGTGSFFVSFHRDVSREFVILLLRSDAVRSYLAGKAVGTTMVNLNHGILKRIPVALPPAAEQHRIVAKVDELMALCDQLEAQLTTTQTDSRRLLEAVVEAALAPA